MRSFIDCRSELIFWGRNYFVSKIRNEIVTFRSITLKPGDVILTGTPSGVGMHRSPPEFLKPGDVIESEIQNLGKIVNKVVKDTP